MARFNLPLPRDWLSRVPAPWRGAAFVTFADRPVSFLAIFTVGAAVVSTIAGWRDPSRVNSLFAFLALVLALAMTRGIISRDRRDSRWIMLFQRATSPARHYARVIVLAFMLLVLLLALAALPLVASRFVQSGSARTAVALLAGSSIWATVIFCVTIGISSLVRRYDLELFLLLLTLSVVQVFLMDLLSAPASARHVATYLLIPVDPAFLMWATIGSAREAPSLASLAHLVLYPLAWLGIAAVRIESFETRDLPGEEETR